MVVDKKVIEEVLNKMSGFQDGAEKYISKKNDDVEGAIKAHPKSFVLGAFLGGLVLGLLVSKVNSCK
jgi:hypothetical protein